MNEPTHPPLEISHGAAAKVRSVAGRLLLIGFMLSVLGVWILVGFTYEAPLFLVIAFFVASMSFFIKAAHLLKSDPNITVALIGLGLACLSFVYQPLGPEIRKFGTECVPIEDCYIPVRGAGLPVQYMIDQPGITHMDWLGFEDEFRLWAFVQDVIFYIALGQFAYRLIRYYHSRKSNAWATAG